MPFEPIGAQERTKRDIFGPLHGTGKNKGPLGPEGGTDPAACSPRLCAPGAPLQLQDQQRFGGKARWKGQRDRLALFQLAETVAFRKPDKRAFRQTVHPARCRVHLAFAGQQHRDKACLICNAVKIGFDKFQGGKFGHGQAP